MGRFDLALDAATRAQRLDPLSPIIARYIGRIHYFARQYPSALDALQRALDLNPNYVFTHMYFVTTYERLHQYDRALVHRQKYWSLLGRSPEDVAELGEIFRSSGYRGALRRWARDAEARTNRTGYLTSTELTHVYAEISDVEAGIRWLRRAIDDGARDVIYLAIEPGFDALRTHPQFAEIVRSAREPMSNARR